MVIFIVQDSGQDFTNLLKISENIVTIAQRDHPLFGDASEHIEKIRSALDHFDVENDAIVPSGDPINISIVSSILSKKKGGENGVLFYKWNRQTSMYVPVRVRLNGSNPVDKPETKINNE